MDIRYRIAPRPGTGAVILIAVFAPSSIAMLTAVGFGFLGAVVDEDGTVNHTLSIFSVYPRRDPYPPQQYTKLCRVVTR